MSSVNTSAPSMTMSSPAKKTVAKKTAPVVAPVSAPVAPVVAPEVKKASKKASAPVVAPAPVAESSPVETAEGDAPAETSFDDELAAAQTQLGAIREAATQALAALKRLAKRHGAEMKDARKNRRKARKETDGTETRRPNNFEIPVAVSDELSAFFGGGKSATMSRAQVNKAMSEYIKKNSLGQGQKINPDAALKKLLRIADGDDVTIFNIQKYLKAHYPAAATKA